VTERTIARKERDGRGAGRGREYRPWLPIQDVASIGTSERIRGTKTGREHHFHSQLERGYFLILEWSPTVIDIREQFPLMPQEMTLRIARELGYKHPAHPSTRHPIIMTTDFLVTVNLDGREVLRARTVKPASELANPRVVEKFRIERRYWEIRDIDWGIVTERDIPAACVRNVALIHHHASIDDRVHLPDAQIQEIANILTGRVLEFRAPLRQIAREVDQEQDLQAGTSLTIAYHLIAMRKWHVDIYELINPDQKLDVLSVEYD